MLPLHSKAHFKASVTFVTLYAFYKGNLSNKLCIAVRRSAIPYLSYFTACGWMPSCLGDLLLFILLYFFFLSLVPLMLRSEARSHTRWLKRETGAEPSWTPMWRILTQRSYLTFLLWSDLSQTLLFHLIICWPRGCSGRFPACDVFERVWLFVFMTLA